MPKHLLHELPSTFRLPSLAEIGTPFAPPNPERPQLRVALINPPDPSSSDSWNRWIPPLGLGYLASVARSHGFHVDLFDLSRDFDLGVRDLQKMGLFDYEVYGLSTYTEIWPSCVSMVRQIRNKQPTSVIVVGGYHATSADAEILIDYPEIDFVIRNEGEEPFTELLNALVKNHQFDNIEGLTWRDSNGKPLCNPPRSNLLNLNLLPYPVRDFVHFPKRHWNLTLAGQRANKDVISLVSSRGCPKRCTFCSIIVLSPSYRIRSADSLMEEIRYLYAKQPFGHIIFQDANFFVKVSRTIQFARELHAFNPSITWSGTATADQVSRHGDVLNEIGQLNCAFLEIGIESGNDATLGRFNKKTRVEHNEEALLLLSRAGIGIGLDFIMFEPDMTINDLKENVRFLFRNELFGYWPCEHLFQELRLFPGTPMREEHRKRLGIEFNPHEMPETPLYDPALKTAWRCMHWYMANYHLRVNQLMREIIEPVNRLLFGNTAAVVDHELLRLCQRAHASMVHLRHLPYHFLERLTCISEDLLSTCETEEAIANIELGDLDARISEAECIRDELISTVWGTDLHHVLNSWKPGAVGVIY